MKNLQVFLFQQSWFHLGSLIESILVESRKYKNIEVHFLGKGLFVYPINVHQNFCRQSRLIPAPEVVMSKFLKEQFKDSDTNFTFTYANLMRDRGKSNLLSEFIDLKSLQKVKWGDTSIGMAISSYLISLTKDSNPNLNHFQNLITNLGLTYFQIFQYLMGLNLNSSSNEIWIYNGRPFHERTVVEFARKNDIELKYFEIGGEGFNQERWILHEESPHDRLKHQHSIKVHCQTNPLNYPLIESWFKKHQSSSSKAYAIKTNFGISYDMSPNTFVFFSSSDDEVAAISDSWQSSWGNQLNCVAELMKYFELHPELSLIIRVHPNQGNKSKQDKLRWKSISSEASNIKIYNFDSKVNSYELLAKAIGVFTFGSTIGVEAAYLRKPAALLAPARWDQLIPHKYLQTNRQIDQWVQSTACNLSLDIEHLNECYEGSLKWAHYMNTAGKPWGKIMVKKDFRGVNVGFLGGKSLKPSAVIIALSRLVSWLHFQIREKRAAQNYWPCRGLRR
jgi:hypothetical protein